MRSLILVVDDFPSARDLYVRVFKAAGYDVEEARNGHEALEKTLRLNPDLVLLDLIMPGMDGWEVARRLRQQGTGAPLVALITGAPDVDDPRRARAQGCSFIVKPVLPDALLRMAHDLLNPRIAC